MDKKIIAIAAVVIVIVAAVASWQFLLNQSESQPETEVPNVTPSTLTLTLVGGNGEQVILDENNITELTIITADGGTKTNKGAIKDVGTYTGVPILEVLDLVGGVPSGGSIKVTAADGYNSTVAYTQLNGEGLGTYDTEANVVEATEPLTVIVAYAKDGTALTAEDSGPVRIAVVGPEGVITSGNVWSMFVVKIEVVLTAT
jgi:DMSO/TMAO reductase YedYZ molybdopterin-dependent catalytic subunit